MTKEIIFFVITATVICSCGGKTDNQEPQSADSTETVVPKDSIAPARADAQLLEGYEKSEAFGIKAWIDNGEVKWQLVSKDAWVKFSDMIDFVRANEGQISDIELPEKAVGVKIARYGKADRANAALFIISESGHVYTMQLNEAVAEIILTAAKLPYGEHVNGFVCGKKGNKYVVSTVQSDGGSVGITMYGQENYMPRDFTVTSGDKEYMFSMQSSWACQLDVDGKTYRGTFVAVGDLDQNKWSLTFRETIAFVEDHNVYTPIKPITVYMEWDDAAETATFGNNPFGIEPSTPLVADIVPLYD